MALMAVACGSSDSSGSLDEFVTPSNAAAGDSGDGGSDSDGIELPTDVGDILGLSDECEAIANVFLSMSSAFLGGDALDADLGSLAGLPGDLQDDAALVVEVVNELYAGLDSLGIDLSDPAALASIAGDQAAEFGELADSLDTAEFEEASENLSAYAEAECDPFAQG